MANDEETRSSVSNLELDLRFIKDDVDGLRNDGRLEKAVQDLKDELAFRLPDPRLSH